MTRRHSPAVYRRRRLVALLLVLIVVGGIGWGVWALVSHFSGDAPTPPASSAQPPAASDPPATPDPSEEPTGTESTEEPDAGTGEEGEGDAEPVIGDCVADNVDVVAVTDATSYRSGALPKLSIQLTNTGPVDCTMNVGSSQQTFTITSGSDVWWRSTDCQSESSDMIVTLEAGQKVTTQTPIEWKRERSSVSTCDADSRPKASGGGAAYHLSVSIGGFESTRTKQFFLH